jgi:hypothetical protein
MVSQAAASSALWSCSISFGLFEQKKFRNLTGPG